MSSNVLKPDLLWIEGRCYRVNDSCTEVTTFQEHDLYESEGAYDNQYEEDDDDDFQIVELDNSRYSTSFHVSKHYLGSIIGKKGYTKSRIEHETKTEIKIPKQGHTGDIVILGSSTSNVKTARRRINMIVISSRMKQRATHFISIPMNKPDIMKNFYTFKESVLRDCPSRGLDESIFIKPEKLHLTIGVMCLMDNEERMIASQLLTNAKERIIMPILQSRLPLRIRVKGLSYMNDDPREINVLYGKVEEEGGASGTLQELADKILDYFYKEGYMRKEFDRDNVKLHVTLINSKYRKTSSSQESIKSRGVRETFDGSEILDRFGDYDFGAMELSEIHLSQRHAVGPDGFYQSTCIITCH